MKAWKIRRARKKILSKGYYEKRLKYFADMCERWHSFYEFKCSSVFVGGIKADYNTRIYERENSRALAQYQWYKKKLGLRC